MKTQHTLWRVPMYYCMGVHVFILSWDVFMFGLM